MLTPLRLSPYRPLRDARYVTSMTCRPTQVASEFLAFSEFRDLVHRAIATHAPNGPRYSMLSERGSSSVHTNLQAQRLRELQAECTFQPAVNARSERLAASRRDPVCPKELHPRWRPTLTPHGAPSEMEPHPNPH